MQNITLEKAVILTDELEQLLREDPVRPMIPPDKRIGVDRDVFILREDGKPSAITCVSYQCFVPSSEQSLFITSSDIINDVAIFYSIWSYQKGAGRRLIIDALAKIKYDYPQVCRFLTLSPLTEMARSFHLKNGATIFRTNSTTVNYEYT